MQSTVTIRDYPCGSGKTTSMIEGFRSDRKYLVIVPLLTEVNRVIECSKSVPFQQPHANDNNAPTKTEILESMVLQGENIAATHSLHERLVPLARRGLLSDYDIIIDEVPEVVRSVSSRSKVSSRKRRGGASAPAKTGASAAATIDARRRCAGIGARADGPASTQKFNVRVERHDHSTRLFSI